MSEKPVAAGKSSFDRIDRKKAFEAISLAEQATLLDLGSGAGKYSLAIAEEFRNTITVSSVDLWQEGINLLQGEAERLGLENIHTKVADIRQPLPYGDAMFDSTLMATVLHDLTEPERPAVIQEIYRVLKPGGTLAIIEFKKIDAGAGPPLRIRLDEQEVTGLVSQFGFERESETEVGEHHYLVTYRKKIDI